MRGNEKRVQMLRLVSRGAYAHAQNCRPLALDSRIFGVVSDHLRTFEDIPLGKRTGMSKISIDNMPRDRMVDTGLKM
jgi:hypothetical protein